MKRVCERVSVLVLMIRARRQLEVLMFRRGSEAVQCFDCSCWYITSAEDTNERAVQWMWQVHVSQAHICGSGSCLWGSPGWRLSRHKCLVYWYRQGDVVAGGRGRAAGLHFRYSSSDHLLYNAAQK